MVSFVIVLGTGVIAWDALRGGAPLIDRRESGSLRIAPDAIATLLQRSDFRALVPLAPPPNPAVIGNPNPFVRPVPVAGSSATGNP